MHMFMSCTISNYSLTTHHIISHSTGVSNPCTCTGAELFQIWFHPRDFLCMFISDGPTSPKWSPVTLTHFQTETLKGTGSPYRYIFYLVEDGPLCLHMIRAKRVFFDTLVHFNLIIIRCIFFLITLISDGFLSWVYWLNLFMENIDVAVCASLSWGLATWRESVEADCQLAIYKATRPEYCIAFHLEPRPDQLIIQYHHIGDSCHPFIGCSSRRTCLFEAAHYSRPIIL